MILIRIYSVIVKQRRHTVTFTKTEIEALEVVAKGNISPSVALSCAKSFQKSAARWYAFAHKCENTGSGPEFKENFMKRAAFDSAMARALMENI